MHAYKGEFLMSSASMRVECQSMPTVTMKVSRPPPKASMKALPVCLMPPKKVRVNSTKLQYSILSVPRCFGCGVYYNAFVC